MSGNGPIDQRVDESLTALGAVSGPVPPLGDALDRELEGLGRTRTRVPTRQVIGLLVISLLYGGGLLAHLGLRPDLSGLPLVWVIGFAAVWLASFASIMWLVVMPPRGQVMPRWRWAAVVAAASTLLLIAGGLALPRSAPGSITYQASVAAVLRHSPPCLTWGLIGALVPAVLAGLAVRGAVPVGTRTAAAALGAASGALGGLVLLLHCPVSEPYHVGLVHGGVVVLAALLAALAASVGVATTRRAK